MSHLFSCQPLKHPSGADRLAIPKSIQPPICLFVPGRLIFLFFFSLPAPLGTAYFPFIFFIACSYTDGLFSVLFSGFLFFFQPSNQSGAYRLAIPKSISIRSLRELGFTQPALDQSLNRKISAVVGDVPFLHTLIWHRPARHAKAYHIRSL